MKLKAIGNAALLGALGLLMAGCATARVEADIRALVRQNEFQQARDYPVVPLSSEDRAKERLMKTLIEPEEAKFIAARIRTLRSGVLQDLENGDDIAARARIYNFGVTGQPLVDGPVFAVKTALLNSHVNPATYKRIEAESKAKFDPLFKADDFNGIMGVIEKIALVPAYADAIDDSLENAGECAVAQHCEETGVAKLVLGMEGTLYEMIATREGRDSRQERPDWACVEESLDSVRLALIQDDVPAEEAKDLMDGLLAGLKSLFIDDETGENLTTAELNEAIVSLRAQYRMQASDRLAQLMAAAAADEAAKYRKAALQLASQAAKEVDMQARVRAFTGAVGTRNDIGVDRLLGSGARVLRLRMAQQSISREDATDLLLASSILGFRETALFAVTLQADVNGTSDKDPLARTPYLLALESGHTAELENILKGADRSRRDAKGAGALHYAIRAGDAKLVAELLNVGLDASVAAEGGMTPLMLAADMEQGPIVQALLPLSAVNAADAEGYTALLRAASHGNLNLCKALLAGGADVSAVTKENDGALELAVLANADDLMAYLLDDCKAAVRAQTVDQCVVNDRVLALRMLVARGAKVTDRHLAAAVKKGYLDMVEYLVSLGRDVNADAVHGAEPVGKVLDYLVSQGYR